MSTSNPVHAASVGPVTATVHRVDDLEVSYHVTIASRSTPGRAFPPDELLQVAEAAEKARLFICFQEQIGRMNWCPGCGG